MTTLHPLPPSTANFERRQFAVADESPQGLARLRHAYAAAALTGILARNPNHRASYADAAQDAVHYADATIEALAAPRPSRGNVEPLRVTFLRTEAFDEDGDAQLEPDMPVGRLAAWKRDEWHYVGIIARATIKIPYGGASIMAYVDSPGVWHVESDAGEEHLNDLYQQEIKILRDMLTQIRTLPMVDDPV